MVALVVLATACLLIIILGFFAPAVAREYALQAMVVEPTNVSVDSFTSNGVRARVQAIVGLDASRVRHRAVRDLGRAGTWIVGRIKSEESTVRVYVPEYGNVLLGLASVPAMTLDIRNGHHTQLDFLTDVQPGEVSGIRTIANDWLEGRLGQLRLTGKTELRIKAGPFRLGTQSVSETFAFEGQSLYSSFSSTRFAWSALRGLTRTVFRPRPPRYPAA